RYASPAGSGSSCTAAAPCTVTQAVTGAVPGDEVTVEPGDYQVTTTLQALGITIHGVAGQPRPRLLFTGKAQQGLKMDLSTLQYVEVDQDPASEWPALYASRSLVDQVKARGVHQAAVVVSGMIRNSITVASGDPGVAGVALQTYANGASVVAT